MSLPKFLLMTLMIIIPAILRLVDIGWNATPIGAIALFAGATFINRKLAFAVPICAMIASDLMLGWRRHDFEFYTFHRMLPIVYGCYAASVCLGFAIRQKWNKLDAIGGERGADLSSTKGTRRGLLAPRMLPVALATLAGALLFFVVTNFGDWLVYYDRSWNGLAECYIKALPFFRNTLAADVFGAIVLFGGYEVVCRRAAVADPTGLLHAR